QPPTVGDISTIVVQGNTQQPLWFDAVGMEFVARFNLKPTLVHDEIDEVYRLTYPDGTVVEFDHGNGAFQRQIEPGGTVIQATAYLSNGCNLSQVERACTVDGVTVTEQLHYEYSDSSGDQLLSRVTLRRKVDSGAWTNISRATYTYYGYQEAHGGEEDLKTAVT